MKSSRLSTARIAPSSAFIAVVLCTMLPQTRRVTAQQLDESCTVTVNGQTVQVNHDGSFVVPNIAAADLFGAGGPGTPPDFLSDDFLRVVGTCMSGPQPLYVYGECFRIRRGESSQVGNLTFSSIPPQSLATLIAAPGIPTLTAIGQQTLINLTGSFSDGTSGPLNPQVHCPATFRTSNPAIVSVVPDAANPLRGVATAQSAGTALITASVEGATSVTAITVAPGDPLTTVTGIVQTIDGDPVDGATVRFVVNGALIAGSGLTGPPGQAPGQFTVPGVASQLGPISAYATATISGTPRSGVSLKRAPVASGFTDAGLITLDNRVFWITNADGPWTTVSNWVSGALPTLSQIAVIDVPNNITVTLQQCPTCTTQIAGIECAETFAFVNGGLNLSGPSVFHGAYIAGIGTGSGAFLNGAGTVTFNGPVTLNPGTLGSNQPGGQITLNAGLTTASASASQFFGRTFVNANNGVIALTGTGSLGRGFGSVLNNPLGSVFDIRTDADSPDTAIQTPPSVINNGGVFRKSGGNGLSTVGGVFNNTGTVEIQTGTLQLPGGTSSGSFTVSPGAALEFATTLQIPQNISGSVTVPATGALQFTGFLSTTNFTGPTQVSGQIFASNGNANFNATASVGLAPSSISITAPGAAASALRFVGPISTGSVSIDTQGILSVAGTLTVNGPFNWTSGDHGDVNNPGTTILNGGMNLPGTGSRQLIARTLTNSNNGSIVWSGGVLNLTSGSVINNLSGSTFDVQTENDLGGSGVNVLNNAGAFRKSAGTANSTIVALNVQNSGLIEAVAGTLEFPSANTYIQASGDTVLSGGAMTKSGAAMQINGGTIGLGAGTSSGSITGSVTCGGTVTPRPGGAGKLTISGTYTQSSGGALDIELGGTLPATEFDQLAVGGTAALGGTLKLTLINGFTPTVGQQFTVVTAGTVSGTFASTVLTNFPVGLAATVSYSGTAATVTIINQ